MKTFLYVYGDGDYDAVDFQDNYNIQDFYEYMLKLGYEKIKTKEDITVEIRKYEVSNEFLQFMQEYLLDYETSKAINIFEVEELKL